jgi:hypothetical protein
MLTKDQKRDKRLEKVFTVLLAIVPAIPEVPIMPWGAVLLLLASLLALHLVWTSEPLSNWTDGQKILLIVFLLACSYVFIWPLVDHRWRKEMAAETSGDLVAGDDGMDHSRDPRTIRIGDGPTTVNAVGPDGKPTFSSPDGVTYYEDLTLERIKGRLTLSAHIIDGNKNQVASIENNHWVVYPSAIGDKNYNADSLEIKDSRGRVIFQVRLLEKEIRLQWEFARDDNKTGEVEESGKYSKEKGILPMFKYPSNEHRAELSGDYAY